MAVAGRLRSQPGSLAGKPTVTLKKRGLLPPEPQGEDCKIRCKKLMRRESGGRGVEEDEEKPGKSASTAGIAEEGKKQKRRVRLKAVKAAEEAERPRKRRGRKRAEAVQVTEETDMDMMTGEATRAEEIAVRCRQRRVKAERVVEDSDRNRTRSRTAEIQELHEEPEKRRSDSVHVMEEDEEHRGRSGALEVMPERPSKLGAVAKTWGAYNEVRRRRGARKIQEYEEKPIARTDPAEILKQEWNLKDVKVEEERPGKTAKKIIRITFTRDPYATESSTDEEEVSGESDSVRGTKSYLYEVEVTQIDCHPSLQKLENPSLQKPPLHKNEQNSEVSSKREEEESSTNTSGSETRYSDGIEDCFPYIPGPIPDLDVPLKDIYHYLLLN